MPQWKPQWIFTRTANLTWAWRIIPRDGGEGETENAFLSLDQAMADATVHGFDPLSQYWITRVGGRTTHYCPGKSPVNLTADETPPD